MPEGKRASPRPITFYAGSLTSYNITAKTEGSRTEPRESIRPYSAKYYLAFVLDPLDNNIEVLRHRPAMTTATLTSSAMATLRNGDWNTWVRCSLGNVRAHLWERSRDFGKSLWKRGEAELSTCLLALG